MQDKIDDLLKRREQAYHAGSQRSVDRQHEKGKLLARERIEYLLDDGSFHELDLLARHRALSSGIDERPYTDGVITGWGTVNGRKVFVFSQDFTVFGGALYGFANDVDGHPTCNDACADAWPPALVDGAELPAGLDPAVFSVVTRDDGTNQLKAGAWPLYRFAGDAAPGETNGQGSGGVWFAVDPFGGLI